MKPLLRFSIQFPRAVIFLLIILTALLSTQLSNLKFDISAQSMLVRSDPLWLAYQQALQTFGSDNVVIVYLHDDNLFSLDKLELIKQTVKQLSDLEFVKISRSLFNVPNYQELDGYIINDAFLKLLPENEQQAQKVIEDATNNPLVTQNLISLDGKSMAIYLSLDGMIHYPGREREITDAIEQTLQPLKGELDSAFQMSSAYVRNQISRQIKQDQKSILPAALAVLIIVLGVSLKRFNSALVPALTSIMSIIITLAIMALLDIPINVLTSIIPALLIIIGSTEDVHLLSEYHDGIERGLSRSDAVAQLPVKQSLAISLAFITTFMGFLSITFSELELLSEFGWLISMGLLINFLITILFVPAYLKLFGGKSGTKNVQGNLYQQIFKAIFNIVIKFKRITIFLALLILFYFAWGTQYLHVNNNKLAYFSADSEINQRAETIHQNLSGMLTFSIILDSGIEDTFLKVRYLAEIEQIQQFIKQRAVLDKSFSFTDFMKLTHKVMDELNKPELPEEDEVIQAYMSLVQHSSVMDYVNEDFSQARILVRHNIGSSYLLEQELSVIREFIKDELKTSLNISFTGESILNNRASDEMAAGQIQSLIIMITVIVLLVSMLFIDFRAGLLALVPNIFPVVVLFGVMGYFNIPLDSGTTMVAIIALGICVDDTIHFLSRYHFFTRGNQDVEKALKQTVEHEATPIVTTSIALALGFSMLTLSSFQPVVNFGALSAMVIILALISTFVLTPVLLSFTRLITVWDMLSINLKSAVIKRSAIFKDMNNIQIKKTILSGQIRLFYDGDVMIEQGSKGSDLYVILEGDAIVTHKDRDGSIHTIGQLTAGELFGEVSLLSEQQRIARVSVEEFAKVLLIKWESINQLGRFHPRISMKLFRNLSTILSQRMLERSLKDGKIRDELTGAMTKPYLYEQLHLEMERCKRHQEKLSAILMDIDLSGSGATEETHLNEKAIKVITRVIAEELRRVDVFARWGEFRFIILLPRTTGEKALEITDRMKIAIEKTKIPNFGRTHISATVTETDGHALVDELIAQSEKKLEQAKKHGRSMYTTLVDFKTARW